MSDKPYTKKKGTAVLVAKREVHLLGSVLEMGELLIPLVTAVDAFPVSETFFKRLEKVFGFFSSTFALFAGDALAAASI